MQWAFHFKKISQFKSDVRSCRFTNFSLKQASGLKGGGFRTLRPSPRHCTLRPLLTNVKDKDKPQDRQGAVYKIKCYDCQASYIGETGRNLSTRLTEHKRATRNGDVNNHIAEHHLKTKHQIDWDSATCITYSTDYYQHLTLESWFTNLEQMPKNHSQQLTAPYKRLIDEIKEN